MKISKNRRPIKTQAVGRCDLCNKKCFTIYYIHGKNLKGEDFYGYYCWKHYIFYFKRHLKHVKVNLRESWISSSLSWRLEHPPRVIFKQFLRYKIWRLKYLIFGVKHYLKKYPEPPSIEEMWDKVTK